MRSETSRPPRVPKRNRDRRACRAQRQHLVDDEPGGAGIEAPGRLMRDQHGRLAVEFARDDDLLLVAAGQPRGEDLGAGRANVVFAISSRALPTPPRRAKGPRLPRAAAAVAQHEVFLHRQALDQRRRRAVGRHVGHARPSVPRPRRVMSRPSSAIVPARPGEDPPTFRQARSGRCRRRRRRRGFRLAEIERERPRPGPQAATASRPALGHGIA